MSDNDQTNAQAELEAAAAAAAQAARRVSIPYDDVPNLAGRQAAPDTAWC